MKKAISIFLIIIAVMLCGCTTNIGSTDYVTPISDFEYIENENGITIVKYTGENTEVVIPEIIAGKPVTVIDGLRAYSITSVSIPDTVCVIESEAFKGYRKLQTVRLPSGLRTIENCAFSQCSNLKNIELPESLTVIGRQAFEECTALKAITIPKSVVEIGDQAFYKCTDLECIIFKESRLEVIGYAAFGETMVSEVQFPLSLRKLHLCAFVGCTRLNKVILNDGLEIIGYQSFAGTAIGELRIPASVEMMDYRAFYKCINPLSLYFEGDIPKDFFAPAEAATTIDGITVYLHEGAKGFSYPFADRFNIKTW